MSEHEAAIRKELESHICPLLRDLVERMERLETTVRVLDGRLERWELHQVAHDRTYPLTQAHIRELEALRAELQQRIKGESRASRNGS